ncbi:unnamed protein product, partial [Trichogramma brassicae]
YLISEHGFKPPAAKVEAITRFPKPSDSTQLRRFIGMLNFYRRCLPHAAELMSPLTDLLRGLQKKKEKLSWSAQADEAFERIKQAMASAVRSAFYHPGQPLALHTDASNTAIGAALSQRHADDDWTPLGFFSQKLSPTQQRYSTYDRELLAIFEAIKYFQRILEGRSFTIMTDHRPLSFALEQKSDRFSPRQSRQLDFISRFDAKIVYTPGDENPVADALSRIDAITMPTTLNSAQISAEQQKDEQLPHLRGKARLKLHDVVIDGLSLVCVEHKNGLKPYLPESLRRQAFDTAHTLSHPSGRATAKRVALLYFWPSMNKDIVRWAKQCVPCQQAKVHRHNRAELGNFVTPDGRFDHIHLDIVKMPLHQGFQNCLTMIDRYTRWPQAIPIADMSAPTVARAFYDGWISFFGTPLTITTDQGAQFDGKLLAELCKLVGAKHVHTSPYHPQSNSMVERLHRTLKAALKCSPETPWTLALPGVLLGLRTTFKEDLQASPAEMVFGTSLRIPGELMMQQDTDKTPPSDFVLALRRLFKAIRPVPASRHAQHRPFVFADLATCDYVFRRVDSIRKPLEQPYTGPHKVIRRINERTFVVDVNGVAKTLSTDQLKPAYLDNANPQPKPDQPTTTRSTQEQDDTQHSATQRIRKLESSACSFANDYTIYAMLVQYDALLTCCLLTLRLLNDNLRELPRRRRRADYTVINKNSYIHGRGNNGNDDEQFILSRVRRYRRLHLGLTDLTDQLANFYSLPILSTLAFLLVSYIKRVFQALEPIVLSSSRAEPLGYLDNALTLAWHTVALVSITNTASKVEKESGTQ